MAKRSNVPWGTLITFPPVGFWQPGLPLAFVRKAWEAMNYGGSAHSKSIASDAGQSSAACGPPTLRVCSVQRRVASTRASS